MDTFEPEDVVEAFWGDGGGGHGGRSRGAPPPDACGVPHLVATESRVLRALDYGLHTVTPAHFSPLLLRAGGMIPEAVGGREPQLPTQLLR